MAKNSLESEDFDLGTFATNPNPILENRKRGKERKGKERKGKEKKGENPKLKLYYNITMTEEFLNGILAELKKIKVESNPTKLNLKAFVNEKLKDFVEDEAVSPRVERDDYEKWYIAILAAIDALDQWRVREGYEVRKDIAIFKEYWLSHQSLPQYYTIDYEDELEYFDMILKNTLCLFESEPKHHLFAPYRKRKIFKNL